MTDRELNLLRALWMAGEFDGNICLPSILARRVKRLTFGKALPTTKGE